MEATKKLEWIKERIAEGRTVYLSTAIRHIKIQAKHLGFVRVRGEVLEVLQGKQGWVNANGCKVSAV